MLASMGIKSKDSGINYIVPGLIKTVFISGILGTILVLLFKPQNKPTFFTQTTTFFFYLISFPRIVDVVLERVVRLSDKNHREILAGISAGIMSGRIFVSMDATMYIGAKIVEHLVSECQHLRLLPSLPEGTARNLYAISIATLFTGFAFEPHNLRPSSFTTLMRYSGGSWWHILTGFSQIRKEKGIPEPERFEAWFKAVNQANPNKQ